MGRHYSYEQIFGRLVKSAYEGELSEEKKRLNTGDEHVARLIEYASGQGRGNKVVYKVKDCGQDQDCQDQKCQVACLFGAITRDEQGNVVIMDDYCLDCGKCVEVCEHNHLIDIKEFVPLVEILKDRKVPVFAIVAPAYIGQFGEKVTPGKFRAALKKLGFYGMVEVALFADMLTLKEALEFDVHIREEGDFFLTSCCCPIWVSMIKKVYNQLIHHVSPSVSPMVACARGVKKIHPEAKVVFIGPCIAKKAEAKEPDVRDAVDAVLTFQEVKQIFEVLEINPEEMEEDESEHSSTAGRIYARTGGVSEAVKETLERIRPGRKVKIKTAQADGVKDCKRMLQEALNGEIYANFYEGMGCVGGCVGGPKANIDPGLATRLVNEYGSLADSFTPVDNPFVLEALKAMGILEIDDLLEGEKAKMFYRDFHKK